MAFKPPQTLVKEVLDRLDVIESKINKLVSQIEECLKEEDIIDDMEDSLDLEDSDSEDSFRTPWSGRKKLKGESKLRKSSSVEKS